MNPDNSFRFANSLAFVLWVLLIAFPQWQYTDPILLYTAGIGLAAMYAYYIISNFGKVKGGGFMTLDQVTRLFTDKKNVLGGWIHYLVFDLMVGMWISHHAFEHGFSRFLLIPCLIFTFLLGPSGLLLYLILQAIVYQNFPLGF